MFVLPLTRGTILGLVVYNVVIIVFLSLLSDMEAFLVSESAAKPFRKPSSDHTQFCQGCWSSRSRRRRIQQEGNHHHYEQGLILFSSSFSSSSSATDHSHDSSWKKKRRRRTAKLIGRKRQDRRKPSVNRRPKYYWTNHDNLRRELLQFWTDCGVHVVFKTNNNKSSSSSSSSLVLIPSEILLYHYGRHDLRAAIATQGGRSILAETLPARIMPGRWKDAVADPSCRDEMQLLLQADSSLSSSVSPAAMLDIGTTSSTSESERKQARQGEKPMESVGNNSNQGGRSRGSTEMSHDGSDSDDSSAKGPSAAITTDKQKPQRDRTTRYLNRKPRGYWSLDRVLLELYQYVHDYRRETGRPSVWMPRPSELVAAGRSDLRNAMIRFGRSSTNSDTGSMLSSSSPSSSGTTRNICKKAGMISYREWYYFEGQYELLTLLKAYLDEHHDGDYTIFPVVSEIKRRSEDAAVAVAVTGDDEVAVSYAKLHSLIQYYGGRKFLAARWSMNGPSSNNKAGNVDLLEMNWGPFDLDFAIRLLSYIRQDLQLKTPPLQRPVIAMPTRSKLLNNTRRKRRYGPRGRQAQIWNEAISSKDKYDEGVWLDQKIQEYGGYENVARRLGLAFFE